MVELPTAVIAPTCSAVIPRPKAVPNESRFVMSRLTATRRSSRWCLSRLADFNEPPQDLLIFSA